MGGASQERPLANRLGLANNTFCPITQSFGVRGMDDVDELGIKGPYRRDFERLYLGSPVD